MKYTMKMVLIPETEYRRLLPEGGVRDKVNKILRGKRDRKAATEMTQLFGQYLRTTKPEKPIPNINKEEIVKELPPIYHEKVRNFLTELEKYGSTWTNNLDFVTKSGHVIGDIVALLKEAFVGTKGKRKDIPQGWEQFLQEIVDANITRSIFSKTSTKDDIRRFATTPTQKRPTTTRTRARTTSAIPIEWENF